MRKLQMRKPCQLDLNRDLHPYMLNSKPYSFHNITHLPWIAWLRKGKGGTMRNGIKTSLASASISIYFSIIFQGPSKLSIFDHGALSLYMYSDFDMGKKCWASRVILLSSDPMGSFRFALPSENIFGLLLYKTIYNSSRFESNFIFGYL